MHSVTGFTELCSNAGVQRAFQLRKPHENVEIPPFLKIPARSLRSDCYTTRFFVPTSRINDPSGSIEAEYQRPLREERPLRKPPDLP